MPQDGRTWVFGRRGEGLGEGCVEAEGESSEKLERQTWALSPGAFATFLSPEAGNQVGRGLPLVLLVPLG